MSTAGGQKACRPAPALLPVINDLEARIKYHFSISDSPYDLRRPVYRVQPFRFLDLPAEVRERVYELTWGTGIGYSFFIRLCYPSISIRRQHDRGLHSSRGTTLLRVNRQVSREAGHVLYSQTPLRIDSAPYKRPENLLYIGSVRTRWFMSTTRSISIRSNFGFNADRNETWVKGLGCFDALLSVEMLLDLDLAVEEESLLEGLIVNLLPFAALKCDRITFRGPPCVQESTKKEVEVAWQEALEARQAKAVAPIKFTWDYIQKRSRRALEGEAAQEQ